MFCAASGLVLATLFNDGVIGIRVPIFIGVVAAGLIFGVGAPTRQQAALLALALLTAASFAVRVSVWTLAPALAALLVLLLGYLLAASRSVFDLAWSYARRWGLTLCVRWVPSTPVWLLHGAETALPGINTRQSRALLKAVAVTAPIVLTLTALLVWADPIFGGLLEPDITVSSFLRWCAWFVIGVLVAGGLIHASHLSSRHSVQEGQTRSSSMGFAE
jgi:hypothetical protein